MYFFIWATTLFLVLSYSFKLQYLENLQLGIKGKRKTHNYKVLSIALYALGLFLLVYMLAIAADSY